MAEHATERARFTEMRARALANVLLSGRDDLLVQDLGVGGEDLGIDYLVTIDSKKRDLRQFAVQLKATYSPVTADNANRLLKPALNGRARYGPFPYPTVLFFFTMMEPQSWYTWVFEPVTHEDGKIILEMQEEADCRPLNENTFDQIISCVNTWYDFFYGTASGKKNTRPSGNTKRGVKAVKTNVVISEIDSVMFDYSDALLQAHEELAAAKQCSNYIVKTYPTPLRTLSGLWDREEDERGRAVISLSIVDTLTKKAASASFTRKDLQNPSHVYQKFQHLVGDVLSSG
jgi:hypothetical protein